MLRPANVMTAAADVLAGYAVAGLAHGRALPVVYGYLLRLCGGDRDEAWDLTQDSWLTVIDQGTPIPA